MDAKRILLLTGALTIIALPAHADVFRCVSATDDNVLLTDRPCPAGYRTELVVESVEPARPPAPLPQAPVEAAIANPPPRASAPAPELARLEEENRLLREALADQRLDRIEQRLDDLADRPNTQVYGTVGVPIGVPHARPCRDGRRHCTSPPRKPKVVERLYRGCGTFGCTPRIQRAPWD